MSRGSVALRIPRQGPQQRQRVRRQPVSRQTRLAQHILERLGAELQLARVGGGNDQQPIALDQPGLRDLRFQPVAQRSRDYFRMPAQLLDYRQRGQRSAADDDLDRMGQSVEDRAPLRGRLAP